MRPCSTLLFDLDGTLVDAFTTIHRAYQHTLPLFGRPAPTMAEVRRAVGGGIATSATTSRTRAGFWVPSSPAHDGRDSVTCHVPANATASASPSVVSATRAFRSPGLAGMAPLHP